MKRREFITLLGGAAAASPLVARAQQPAMPVIGFLGASTPSNWATWTTAFVHGLRALGWVEGRTVKIEYRWAEGKSQRYAEIAAEFARLKVDVIVTVGSAVPAAMQATATIPIVFAAAIEPVESGLVASLVKPGGNVTDETRLGKVSRAVQDALMSALGVPPDDFFQIIHILPRSQFLHTPSFLGLKYSDDLILLEITFISGRPKEKRLGLLRALNDGVAAAGIAPDDLMIMFYEVPGENISFGRGLAQRAHISANDPKVADLATARSV